MNVTSHLDRANASVPKLAKGLLPLIGATPMVELTKVAAGSCRLFLKLEGANPGGSIKDRPGWPLQMMVLLVYQATETVEFVFR